MSVDDKFRLSTWYGYFATTLEQVADARWIFMNDIRQFITLVMVLFLTAGFLYSYALQAAPEPLAVCSVVLSLIVLLFAFCHMGD
ncbi:MAG: hypothetical protein AAF623_20170 [Planctomycetota bacterium]